MVSVQCFKSDVRQRPSRSPEHLGFQEAERRACERTRRAKRGEIAQGSYQAILASGRISPELWDSSLTLVGRKGVGSQSTVSGLFQEGDILGKFLSSRHTHTHTHTDKMLSKFSYPNYFK